MPSRVVQLLVKTGPAQGKMFFIDAGREAIIGRFASADIRIEDNSVSQRHCKVRSIGDLVFIEDTGSSNGTKVNGEPTVSRVLDEPGEIQVGGSIIQVQWVETDRELPIKAVASISAPTLLESSGPTTVEVRKQDFLDTVSEPSQLQEFREAQRQLGKMVGGFLLMEALGVGDTGVVYRAKDMRTRGNAALKIINRESARTPQLLTRLLSETRINLKIPHAANILGTGDDGKYSYIATELVKGRSLQQTVDGGKRYSAAEAVALALPLCEALGAAHAQQVFHRDVSPINILIAPDGQPVLLDLGMGRKLDMEGRFILRKAEDPVGRWRFMSPEWTLAKPCTAATDVYSLAATLYFAVAGAAPFTDTAQLELVRAVRWDDPAPLEKLRADLPPEFVKVIATGMQKEPAARYGRMADFAAALKQTV